MNGCERLWHDAPDREDWLMGRCSSIRSSWGEGFALVFARLGRHAFEDVLAGLDPDRPSRARLRGLRRRLDGCRGVAPRPDASDWAPCAAQAELRFALERLLRNLRAR